MLKQIHQYDPSTSRTSFKIQAGKYEGILIHFAGTCTGTPVATEFGYVRTTESGRQKDFVDLDRLLEIVDQKYGCGENTLASGSFNTSFFLPFAIPEDTMNVWDVADADNCYMEIQSTWIVTAVAGTVTIFGVMRNGVEGYTSKLVNHDFSYATGHNNEVLSNFENIFDLFIENSDDIDRISMQNDGQLVYDCTDDALESTTHIFNKKETFSAAVTYIELPLSRTGELEDYLSDNIELVIDTNAATDSPSKMVVWMLDFPNQQKITRSITSRNVAVQNALRRKASQGKTRAVNAIAQIKNTNLSAGRLRFDIKDEK